MCSTARGVYRWRLAARRADPDGAARRWRALVDLVRGDLAAQSALPDDAAEAETVVRDVVRERLLQSGRCNAYRAVPDLVRAGLIRRHYQGFRVDHHNRGAQREAVYTVLPPARAVLGKTG